MATRTAEREQFLADIITAAIEGGTGYWAVTLRYKWQDVPPAEVHAVIMPEEEGDEWAVNFRQTAGRKPNTQDALDAKMAHRIDIDTIASGISKIVANKVTVNGTIKGVIVAADLDNDAGMIDADAADCIVQAALFNTLVYG